MPNVVIKSDTLNKVNLQFSQRRLDAAVFLNSVPKCGTHLVKNIFRMFVPIEQQYHKTFIQYPVLRQHLAAFSSKSPFLSWGHLLYADESAIALKNIRQLVIVRDPYDWVLARARFFLSGSFQGSMEHLKQGRVTIEQMLNMMIFGIYQKAPTLHEIYTHNAVAWLGTGVTLVKYEDIIYHLKHLESAEAEVFFANLLAVLGLTDLPADWRERVRLGSDRQQSGTSRDNLSGVNLLIPEQLPDMQKQLVEYAAPGLRRILGYNQE